MDGTRLSDGLSSFARPALLDEALALLSSGDWTILAGGTDYFPGLRDRARQGPVLDISNLQALRGICEDQTHWRIGALTTWSDIIKADMPPAFDALKLRRGRSGRFKSRTGEQWRVIFATPRPRRMACHP